MVRSGYDLLRDLPARYPATLVAPVGRRLPGRRGETGMDTREGPALEAVIVDAGRWHGLSRQVPNELLVNGAPPACLVAVIREARTSERREGPVVPIGTPGNATRERAVLCRYVTQLESQVFYAPAPGQHADDPEWPGAARAVVRLRRSDPAV